MYRNLDKFNDLFGCINNIYIKTSSPKHLFPFEKEIVIFLFKMWALFPRLGPRRAMASQQLARAITVHCQDTHGRPIAGQIAKLSEMRERLNQTWYEQFYDSFYSNMRGFALLAKFGHPARDLDELIDERKREQKCQ